MLTQAVIPSSISWKRTSFTWVTLFSTGSIRLIVFQLGGAIEGMVKVADRVIAMATSGTKIIPGHGPLSNKVELKVYRDMLKAVGKRMADAAAAEKSLADLQQNSPLADLDATWGKGFLKPPKFLELVYTGIKQ